MRYRRIFVVMSIGLTDATAIPVTDETVRTVMSLCGFTNEDALLRKIYEQTLRMRVVILPNGNSQVDRPCFLGQTCKQFHALFSTAEIREHVMTQMRSIRNDFLRRVAAWSSHAVRTMRWMDINLTMRLHMNDQWLRVVITVHVLRRELSLVVTSGNTNDRRRQRNRGVIDMSWNSTLRLTPIADRDAFLVIECLDNLQQGFLRIMTRRGQLYTHEHCLFLL